jgi:hypothetical protein
LFGSFSLPLHCAEGFEAYFYQPSMCSAIIWKRTPPRMNHYYLPGCTYAALTQTLSQKQGEEFNT